MKKSLWLFLALMLIAPIVAYALVDTRDGTAITAATNIDGFSSNLDDADGQEITASGGATVWESYDTEDYASNNWYDLDSLDAYDDTPSGVITVNASSPLAGSYDLLVDLGGVGTGSVYWTWTFSQTEFYLKFKLKMVDDTTEVNNNRFYLFSSNASGGETRAGAIIIGWKDSPGTWYINVEYYDDTPSQQWLMGSGFEGGTALTMGTTYDVVYHYKAGTGSDGIHALSTDGGSSWDGEDTGIDQDGHTFTERRVGVRNISNLADGAGFFQLDNVTLEDQN